MFKQWPIRCAETAPSSERENENRELGYLIDFDWPAWWRAAAQFFKN